MNHTLLGCILAGLILLTGCTSLSDANRDSARLIVGSWQSDVGGFPVVHTYDESTVSIKGHAPLSYQIKRGTLSIDATGNSPRTVSFPNSDEMLQSDPLTGTTQTFSRMN